LGVDPVVGGIGGGTCAAFFRSQGIPAAVWAQEVDTAHMPNEYAVIEHMTNEAKVFAHLMLQAL
jgi:succinyl-diaminopimelate desuccinylase